MTYLVGVQLSTKVLAEATAVVTEQFSSKKALKKAALDAAIAAIKGTKNVKDHVKDAFVNFSNLRPQKQRKVTMEVKKLLAVLLWLQR